MIYLDVVQFGSMPVLGTGGRGFKSLHPDHLKDFYIMLGYVNWSDYHPYKMEVVGSSPTPSI